MESFRKWFYKPKKDDTSLLAQFFYADEALNLVTAELDSFDGRKDPERCTILVNHLRQCQDKVLNICGKIMNQLIPNERASRDFRVKFPDDVMQENLAGQLWFGAECLAAGSSIMNREGESSAMRPLAKALTKSLENVRNLLREQCFRTNANIQTNSHLFNDKLLEALKIFDRLFADFELRYVSAMVPVKSPREYYLQQLVIVLFSETLQRALRLNLLTQNMVDDYDPALMFAIPRLAIVSGLLIFPDGPICLDGVPADMSEMFRPFRALLLKIRALLWTLNNKELFTLEKLLCSCEDPNIDFSDTNSYTKCVEVEDGDKRSEEKLDNDIGNGCGFLDDEVDYESISSTGNGTDDGTISLPSRQNCSDNNPSDTTNETALTLTRTDSISIPNETSPSGYLIVNQVSLNCITTPNEAPIIVGHSLPDGDHDESLNLVTETLSSLLKSDNDNDASDDILKANLNNNNNNFISNDSEDFLNENGDNYENGCKCFKTDCNCFETICHCFDTVNSDILESKHFETGILENKNFDAEILENREKDYLSEPDNLISPDSGLGHSEMENTLSDRSPDDKVNSPSTSKENSSPNSEKNDFICDMCGKIRRDPKCSQCKISSKEPDPTDSDKSPFINHALSDSSLLDQCHKTPDEGSMVVEEKSEAWVGIATGQGDTKSSDVNFYFQNQESTNNSSQSDLRQNYWDNWETLMNNHGRTDNADSVSLDLPRNFVISVSDERQLTGQSENYRIRTSTLIPLQSFEDSSHSRNGNITSSRHMNDLNVRRREPVKRRKFSHKNRTSAQNSRENISLQIPSHSKRVNNGPPVGSSFSSSCSSCFTSETCSLSSETSSFNSEMQDDEEIALALQAAEAAYRDDTRARFRSSEDLIHRLFVCIAGVADQLQTNFAGDLRNILKAVFSMNATETESEDEAEEKDNISSPNNSGDSSRIENAEEAWENTTPSEIERTDEPTSQEGGSVRAEDTRKEMENPPPWVPDVMAPRCMTCEAVFTLVRRRHHCRNCGKVFCARCSSNSVPLPRYGHIKPVRVCNRCFLYQVTPFTMEEIPTST